ncbi:MAG: response regulator [Tenericutes bacterium]|nr:response regulator [Mycoplasmatota bacterium]
MFDVNYLIENGVDVNRTLDLFGDIDTYNNIIGEFLVSAKEKLEKLEKYKEEKDLANYTIYIHSLRSDAKYFGFTKLDEITSEQEEKSKEGDVFYIYEHFPTLQAEVERMLNVVKRYISNEPIEEETNQAVAQPAPAPQPVVVTTPAQQPSPAENLPEPYTQKTILVADDSNIIRNFVKRIFSEKYNVGVAQNGEEVLNIIKANANNEEIVAILLDLNMPKIDGFAVLDYINDNQLFSKMPVSIISGDSSKDTITKAFSYPIVDMLGKPFTESDVKHVIEKTIYLKNM